MFKKLKPFFMICETPLHAGSGNDLGIIDLPIQRERHTGYPKIESSSVKGAIRWAFEQWIEIDKATNKKFLRKNINGKETKICKLVSKYPDIELKFKETLNVVFGPEDNNSDIFSGCIGFTDARILLFPVKSMKEVYAWITCPSVLKRFKKDMEYCGLKFDFEIPSEKTVPKDSNLLINDSIILEEYRIKDIKQDKEEKDKCTMFAKWIADNVITNSNDYLYEKIKKDIVVLPDEDFADFVNLSTEVITRTKINNTTGTVEQGALFTEEYLPTDTVLYSLVMTSPIFNENKSIFESNVEKEEDLIMSFFEDALPDIIQLGANATIGKGIIRTRVV